MRIEKDGQVLELENEETVAGFLDSGWVVASEPKKTGRKTKSKE